MTASMQRAILTVLLTVVGVGLVATVLVMCLKYRALVDENDVLHQQLVEANSKIGEKDQQLQQKESSIVELSQSRDSLDKSVKALQATKPQKEAADAAIVALKSLLDTWKVGSDIFNLNRLTTEARAKVEEAKSAIPKGKLRSNLESAVASFDDALRANQAKNSERDEYLKAVYQDSVRSCVLQGEKYTLAASAQAKALLRIPTEDGHDQ